MARFILTIFPLLAGWGLDLKFGDPVSLPHPVVWFGKAISACERRLNHDPHRLAGGAVTAIGLTVMTFVCTWFMLQLLTPLPWAKAFVESIIIFYCLAGTTLCREVRMVFEATDRSTAEGRKQVARIVGRDTASLSDQEIRTAALETLSENLSDGVIAPLFWYMLLGVPGMITYKMINTLDSMIAYRNDRYILFGRVAARMDDVANWIPARITAFLLVAASGSRRAARFVRCYGRSHASPNSGYPEAALAGALDCRFGGTHDYFGQSVYKPYIGDNPRPVTSRDMRRSIQLNRRAEYMMVSMVLVVKIISEVVM